MIATAAPEMIAGTSIAAMLTQVQAHVQACSHGSALLSNSMLSQAVVANLRQIRNHRYLTALTGFDVVLTTSRNC